MARALTSVEMQCGCLASPEVSIAYELRYASKSTPAAARVHLAGNRGPSAASIALKLNERPTSKATV